MRRINERDKTHANIMSYFTVANFFTVTNLVIGFLAVVFVLLPVEDRHLYSAIFILLATLCDFLDGYVARKRNETSEFGKQLDSIVDMSSFGVVPAVVFISRHIASLSFPILLCASTYVCAGAIRLARFNLIDTNDGKIKGLPITVAAAILALKNIIDSVFMRSVNSREDIIIVFTLSILMLGHFTLKKIGFTKGEQDEKSI
ncbi:MAG: CDP-diacylglycerol--serine O-phosphatidyltransferase [Tissierellia bacterium]|jgi:CDP-diacylglycerol--serine O-phosphatidyltransferase|nr:CDP-alcohol phosphatidyltransferase family protein [Bacillota bacterium]NLL22703.1 CDP-diacylglycerol--serine O-phosphatidyltransferase [Tissierellia bacterium]